MDCDPGDGARRGHAHDLFLRAIHPIAADGGNKPGGNTQYLENTQVDIRRIILIHPGREGLILGRAAASPYPFRRTFAWRNASHERLFSAWPVEQSIPQRNRGDG